MLLRRTPPTAELYIWQSLPSHGTLIVWMKLHEKLCVRKLIIQRNAKNYKQPTNDMYLIGTPSKNHLLTPLCHLLLENARDAERDLAAFRLTQTGFGLQQRGISHRAEARFVIGQIIIRVQHTKWRRDAAKELVDVLL